MRMIRSTLFRFIFSISLFTLLCAGCKKPTTSSFKTCPYHHITINIMDEPKTLDPRKVRALKDINLIRMFMDGLMRIDKNGQSSLAVAQNVSISDDLKTYIFTLRESKWSNGEPVTAQDFAYAWKKILSSEFNAPNAYMLYIIKNAKEAKNGTLPLSLVGIETPDPHTLIVTLNHPTPYFLELLSHPIYFPVHSYTDRTNSRWADNYQTYVGNGPFVIHDWQNHNVINAKKNEQYWDQKTVNISSIKMIMVSENTGFNMFESKELHWEGSPFSQIPTEAIHDLKEKARLKIAPILATEWIRVNVDRPPLQSPTFRKALAYAINRQSIVEHITQGGQLPATGIVPLSMGLQTEPFFSDGDTTTAQQLFQEALEEMNLSKEQLPSITLAYINSDFNHLIAQAIQQQWRKAFNIQIALEAVESKTLFERMSKQDYFLSLGNWFADFNDPINFLEVFKSKTIGTNNTNWENPHYTQLLENSSYCQNIEERKILLQRSQQILIDEMPIIPIYHFTMSYVHDDLLKDVVFTSMGNIDFKYARLEKE